MKSKFLMWLLPLTLMACSSAPPVKPESKNVEASRDPADDDCRELGAVEGRNDSAKGTFEEALENLKLDAAGKGANYVQIRQSGAMGTSVRGMAYLCL